MLSLMSAIALLIPHTLHVNATGVEPHPDWRNSLAPQGEPGPLLTLAQGGIWRPHYLAWGTGLTPDSFEDVLRLRRQAGSAGAGPE